MGFLKRLFIVAALVLALPLGCKSKKAPPPPPPPVDPHRAAMEKDQEPLMASMKSPEGKTPCETGWNGLNAFIEAWKKVQAKGGTPPYSGVPTQSQFMKACAELPLGQQLCMQPRYQMQNIRECQKFFDYLETEPKKRALLLPELIRGKHPEGPQGQ